MKIVTANKDGAGGFTGNYYFQNNPTENNLAMPTGLEVTANTSYIASVYVWADGETLTKLWIKQYRDDPGYYRENWITTSDQIKEIRGNGQWQRIFVKFKTLADATAITISLVADPQSTTFWDGVQLEKVSESLNQPTVFPESLNFNKPLEDTIGWKSCVATSGDGVNFDKKGPLEITGVRRSWEEMEKPGWVGSSFMYLNPFFYDGYWYAHTWVSGYPIVKGNPNVIDQGGPNRRFGYGDRRTFLPAGLARSGLARSKSLLGPFERVSQNDPVVLPEQLPANDLNSCEQTTRNENSSWGCEYLAVSGVPQLINNQWLLFLSGATSFQKGSLDWDGRKSPFCGSHGITSGVIKGDSQLGPWKTTTNNNRLFLPSEVCSTNVVAEGPIYYFDQASGEYLVFVNDIKAGSIVAFWTKDPLATWPMVNRKTIIGRNQVPWSNGPDNAINLATVVEDNNNGKLMLYFGARATYSIRTGWKDFLFHDIGLLTIDLPLLPPLPIIPGDFNNDGKVDIDDYNKLIAEFGLPYTIFDFNILVENWGK
ncbi:MAG: hypothetical protein Q8P91_02220 [bacterium]|nr:hypothetical protein [bacterium]